MLKIQHRQTKTKFRTPNLFKCHFANLLKGKSMHVKLTDGELVGSERYRVERKMRAEMPRLMYPFVTSNRAKSVILSDGVAEMPFRSRENWRLRFYRTNFSAGGEPGMGSRCSVCDGRTFGARVGKVTHEQNPTPL